MNTDKVTSIFLAVVTIVIMVWIIYLGFAVNRWFNYNFGYKQQVQAEVCKMVKPEYLEEPCKWMKK